MKKFVKVSVVALSILVSSLGLSYYHNANVSEVYAVESTTTTEAETVDLSAKARVYTADELSADYTTSSTITLANNATKSSNSSVKVSGNTVTITESGTYVLSGTLTNGQVIVDVEDDAKVQLVLNGVTITNETASPIFVKSAKDYAMITLAEGTTNPLTDGDTYTAPATEADEELDATIYSKDDLVINGTGTLTVNANYNDAIKSNDDLHIVSGVYNVTSKNDAFYGKDAITIDGGTFNVKTSEGAEAAVMQTNEMGGGMGHGMMPTDSTGTTTTTGMTLPEMPEGMTPPDFANGQMPTLSEGMTPPTGEMPQGGGMRGNANNTQVDATASVSVTNKDTQKASNTTTTTGTTTTTEATTEESTESNKGFKSKGEIVINDGTFTMDTYDDSFNANTFLEINDGTFDIKSGNDGIKADYILSINGGDINISYCYEGIESQELNFNGGNITILATDDGINASRADGTESMMNPNGSTTEPGEGDPIINFNGSNVNVYGKGDSVDSNGGITVNDGNLVVQGVNNGGDLALDCDMALKINGGNLLVVGGVATVSTASTQNVVSTNVTTSIATGDTVKVTDASGNVLFQTVAKLNATAVTFSSSGIKKGATYTVTSGTASNKTTVTTDSSSTVTNKATGGMQGQGGNRGQMGNKTGTTTATTATTSTTTK